VLPVQFCLDDGTPLGDVKLSRREYTIGEGVTLEPLGTGEAPRRYRVVDVDHGLIQTTPKSTTYKDSTTTVYLIEADDPRRERP
jgi:hypothetical protein